ncbi:hypothetical protein ACFE04_025609 [Oxalis oulophora]
MSRGIVGNSVLTVALTSNVLRDVPFFFNATYFFSLGRLSEMNSQALQAVKAYRNLLKAIHTSIRKEDHKQTIGLGLKALAEQLRVPFEFQAVPSKACIYVRLRTRGCYYCQEIEKITLRGRGEMECENGSGLGIFISKKPWSTNKNKGTEQVETADNIVETAEYVGRFIEMNSQATKAYRNLLKAIHKHIGKEDHKQHFREYVTQEFRNNNKLTDPSVVQQKIKLARDYTFLLNSVHHQKDLLFSYNIAVDRSEEMKKVLGKSASSVGLQLPEVYQD